MEIQVRRTNRRHYTNFFEVKLMIIGPAMQAGPFLPLGEPRQLPRAAEV